MEQIVSGLSAKDIWPLIKVTLGAHPSMPEPENEPAVGETCEMWTVSSTYSEDGEQTLVLVKIEKTEEGKETNEYRWGADDISRNPVSATLPPSQMADMVAVREGNEGEMEWRRRTGIWPSSG